MSVMLEHSMPFNAALSHGFVTAGSKWNTSSFAGKSANASRDAKTCGGQAAFRPAVLSRSSSTATTKREVPITLEEPVVPEIVPDQVQELRKPEPVTHNGWGPIFQSQDHFAEMHFC